MCMVVADAVRHIIDRTRTAVGGCVEENVDVPVSQSVEQIVDDPMPQVVMDTVVEQIVDMPVLEFQEGIAELMGDFTVPATKEELADTIRPLPQDCTQGRLAEQIVDFAVPPSRRSLRRPLRQDYFHEQIVEQTAALLVP